jgi:hypothetical protein
MGLLSSGKKYTFYFPEGTCLKVDDCDWFLSTEKKFSIDIRLVRVNTFDLCMYYNIKANEKVR